MEQPFTEPTEEELLKELEALGISEVSEAAPPERELMMMKNIPVDIGDYNVENMQLTPEDEMDPELLAELSSLSGGQPTGVQTSLPDKPNDSLPVREEGEKPKNLPLAPLPTESVEISEVEMLKELALEAKKAGEMEQAREYMSQIMKLQGKPPRPDSNREVFNQLVQQSRECQEAAKIYLGRGDRTSAMDFTRKEKAFTVDANKLKSMKGQKMETEVIPVELPVDSTNYDVKADELLIKISELQVGKRCKLESSKGDYFINVNLDWPTSEGAVKSTGTFSMPGDGWTMMWGGIKKDMRCIKFFEHHRFKLELLRIESGFFRKKNITLGIASIRMGPLVSQGNLKEHVEFMDENRKPIGIGATVILRLRTPLKGSSTSGMKTVDWRILPNGESGRIFKPEADTTTEMDSAEEMVKAISSYVVLEHEIGRIKGNPACESDPGLVALLGALEGKLDELTVKVELGQLTMEDYLEQVKKAVPVAKQRALACKRAGKIADARNWLQHVHIMEEEIAEAENEANHKVD